MTTQTNDESLAGIVFRVKETKRNPLFACLECGKKFYTAKAAEKASFGDNGCPGCGGSDIDIYLEKDAQ